MPLDCTRHLSIFRTWNYRRSISWVPLGLPVSQVEQESSFSAFFNCCYIWCASFPHFFLFYFGYRLETISNSYVIFEMSQLQCWRSAVPQCTSPNLGCCVDSKFFKPKFQAKISFSLMESEFIHWKISLHFYLCLSCLMWHRYQSFWI